MFDPYHKWLGIPPAEQPPNHYRLLGITLFENDQDVIDTAANRQMAFIQGCATGPHTAASQKLLNELAAARVCLLNLAKKAAYDEALKAKLTPKPKAIEEVSVEVVPEPPVPKSAFDYLQEAEDRPAKGKLRPKTRRRGSRLPLLFGGIAVAVLLIAGLAVVASGMLRPRSTTPPTPGPGQPESNVVARPIDRGPGKKTGGEMPPKKGDTTVPQVQADDAARLQGEWVCTYQEASGKPATPAELATMGKTLTVKGKRFTIKRTEDGVLGGYDGEFALTSSTTPKQFEFTSYNLPPWFVGVYELTEDEFKVCYRWAGTADQKKDRATEFKTSGGPYIFNKFRRASTTLPKTEQPWVRLDLLPARTTVWGKWAVDGQTLTVAPDMAEHWKTILLDRQFETFRATAAIRRPTKADEWAGFDYGHRGWNDRDMVMLHQNTVVVSQSRPDGKGGVTITKLKNMPLTAKAAGSRWSYFRVECDAGHTRIAISSDGITFQVFYESPTKSENRPGRLGFSVREGNYGGEFRLLNLETRDN